MKEKVLNGAKCAALVTSIVLGLTATADAQLINQLPSSYPLKGGSTGRAGAISTEYTDNPAFNTYCFDDFKISSSINVWRIVVFGIDDGGIGGIPHLRIQTNRNHLSPGGIFWETANGTESHGDWEFFLPSIPIPDGVYWLEFYVTRTPSQGEWLWAHSNVNQGPPPFGIRGSEYYIQNPASGTGGGRGWGTGGAIPGSDPRNPANPHDPRDLAFQIYMIDLPEPEPFITFGMGLLSFAALGAYRIRFRSR